MADKYCVDCRHFVNSYGISQCYKYTTVNYVTGGTNPSDCYAQRSLNGDCKPQGIGWEAVPAAEPPKTPGTGKPNEGYGPDKRPV